MKQTLSAIVTLLLVFAVNAGAQTSKRDYKITGDEVAPVPAVSNESKAYKNFRRFYPEVADEKWMTDKDHYFVTFSQNDIKNKIVFTRNGRIDYTLKIYDEKELPATVRRSVKSAYLDYDITNVQELVVKNRRIYLVKITDGNSWKTIRVHNGDLEEIEYYVKAISPCR